MKELENKIREALPRLNELTKGCIVNGQEIVHRSFEYKNVVLLDVFSNSYGHDRWKLDLENNILITRIEDVDYPIEIETIGHPIRLNDVLEWLLDFRKYSTKDSQIQEVLNVWNLSSVFLADQSDEFKEFLLCLK